MERKPILTESQADGEPEELNLEQLTWGDLTWINIEGPTEREIEYLAQNYPFHELDLDDCLSRIQRPKIDEYEDYMFIILHFTVYDREKRVSSHSQLSVFIGQKYLITLHSGELKTLVKLFRDCQINEESRRENFSNGPVFLLYRMLDRAVDSYFPILDKILDLMEQVEDSVFDEEVESAQDLAILRRDIITQRRILFPMRTVMAELEVKLRRFAAIDMSVYFGDLIDHMNKICETLDECKELIEVYKDTDYLLSTDRINRIIRILTILSAIILPFVVISSLYGMNVHLPGGLTSGNHVSFIVLIVVMFLFAGGMLYFFHRKRWI
jgi:magnesium transporter